jgi:hypothetical protein
MTTNLSAFSNQQSAISGCIRSKLQIVLALLLTFSPFAQLRSSGFPQIQVRLNEVVVKQRKTTKRNSQNSIFQPVQKEKSEK